MNIFQSRLTLVQGNFVVQFLCLWFIQKEIKKEIERRRTGKEMLEYKRRQEEELTKRMLEERNREKAEEKAARERIRQQIAMVNFSFWKVPLVS